MALEVTETSQTAEQSKIVERHPHDVLSVSKLIPSTITRNLVNVLEQSCLEEILEILLC